MWYRRAGGVAVATVTDLLGRVTSRTEGTGGTGGLTADQDNFRLGRQPADRTRATFELNYGMAQERGLSVEGLSALLAKLELLGSKDVVACVVEGEHAFGLVVLDSELDGVVGVLYVELPGPSVRKR